MRKIQMKSALLPHSRRSTAVLFWSVTILLVVLFLVKGGGKLLEPD